MLWVNARRYTLGAMRYTLYARQPYRLMLWVNAIRYTLCAIQYTLYTIHYTRYTPYAIRYTDISCDAQGKRYTLLHYTLYAIR